MIRARDAARIADRAAAEAWQQMWVTRQSYRRALAAEVATYKALRDAPGVRSQHTTVYEGAPPQVQQAEKEERRGRFHELRAKFNRLKGNRKIFGPPPPHVIN
eukprot:1304573-Amphidinium_carterae.1